MGGDQVEIEIKSFAWTICGLQTMSTHTCVAGYKISHHRKSKADSPEFLIPTYR